MSLPNRRTDETELVARVRAGEESAFTEIVRRHRPRLLAFARRLLAGRSECAEDVVQEALMRAHRALGRDEREMRLAPWLFALTRNCCLDELSRVHCEILVLDEPGEQPLLVDARSPEVVAEGRAGLREISTGSPPFQPSSVTRSCAVRSMVPPMRRWPTSWGAAHRRPAPWSIALAAACSHIAVRRRRTCARPSRVTCCGRTAPGGGPPTPATATSCAARPAAPTAPG
jgi:hypothetical protein